MRVKSFNFGGKTFNSRIVVNLVNIPRALDIIILLYICIMKYIALSTITSLLIIVSSYAMKVAVTGTTGRLGREAVSYLSCKYIIYMCSR